MFGGQSGDSKPQECQGDTYRGAHAFSEPETQALRDFMISEKELKFVYNFHSAGN